MKICIDRGFYKFYPEKPMDIILANELGLGLVACRGFYTFPALAAAPTYSLVGKDLATVQYAGDPETVMGVNEWVYSLQLGRIVPAKMIAQQSQITFDGTRAVCVGIPQAGALISRTERLKSCVVSWPVTSDACIIQGIETWAI